MTGREEVADMTAWTSALGPIWVLFLRWSSAAPAVSLADKPPSTFITRGPFPLVPDKARRRNSLAAVRSRWATT